MKLCSRPMKTPEAFKLKHLFTHFEKERENMHSAFRKDILSKYSKNGEAGAPPQGKSRELNLPFETIEGKEEEAKKVIEDFGKRECVLPVKKITGEFLLSLGEWSPIELAALEPILVELTVVD